MRDWHSMFGGQAWRVTPEGVQTMAPDGIPFTHRSKGIPRTMRLYWSYWEEPIVAAARATGVPVTLLLMTIGCENGYARVDENQIQILPVRREPKYKSDEETPHQISVGPCHVLISTARAVMGNPRINRAWLQSVDNNLLAAARYIADTKARHEFDPILVAAVYNSGGVYEVKPGHANYSAWHLRAYVPPAGKGAPHLDRAAAWYGDAAAVVSEAHLLAQADLAGLGRVA